jgi:endoglucanase
MAVALVQTSNPNSGSSYQLSFSVNLNANVAIGNVVVALVSNGSSTDNAISGVSDNLGNIWVKDAHGFNAAGVNAEVWHTVVSKAGQMQVTMSSPNYVVWSPIIREYSGLSSGTLVDVVATTIEPAYTTTHTATTTTSANANDLVVVMYAGNSSTVAVNTPGTGYGDAITNNGASYLNTFAEDTVVSAVGNITGQFSSDISEKGVMFTLALETAGAHTPTTVLGSAALVADSSFFFQGANPNGGNGIAIPQWYAHGAQPALPIATLRAYARARYDKFMAYCLVQTGMPAGMPAGAYRIQVPDQKMYGQSGDHGTVSEGMGYGMLSSAVFGNVNAGAGIYDPNARAHFDGLFYYMNFFKNGNGLMNWDINPDGSLAGSVNGATDADHDMAMALVLAHRIWGSTTGAINYGAEATKYINAIRDHEYTPANYTGIGGPNVMTNGDGWGFDTDRYMPDYFAPAWYTEYYNHTGDARWQDIKAKNYPLAIGYYYNNFNGGLVPDGSNRAQKALIGSDAYSFGYNAEREGFRVAADFLWNGQNTDPLAYQMMNKATVVERARKNNVATNIAAGSIDLDNTHDAGYYDSAFAQCFGAMALVDSAHAQWAADIMTAIHNDTHDSYFGNGLATMGTMLMAGLFQPGTETGATTAAPPPANTTTTTTTDSADIATLGKVWTGYLKRYFVNGMIQKIDSGSGKLDVVSEQQGYVMHLAEKMNDKTTFDAAETFNYQYMDRRNLNSNNTAMNVPPANLGFNLMGYHFNPVEPTLGKGAMTMLDGAAAFDGDIWRMKALYRAYLRWGNSTSIPYLDRANAIARDLIVMGARSDSSTGYYILLSGGNTLADNMTSSTPEINASYMDIEAMKLAATYDTGNTSIWNKLILGSYDYIQKSMAAVLPNSAAPGNTQTTSANLPANFTSYNFTNGTVVADASRDSNYTYDAFRVNYILRRGFMYDADPGARDTLAKSKPFFTNEWTTRSTIKAEYFHDGTLKGDYEARIFLYAAYQCLITNDASNATALAIYNAKLKNMYVANAAGDYYDNATDNSGNISSYALAWLIMDEVDRLNVGNLVAAPGTVVNAPFNATTAQPIYNSPNSLLNYANTLPSGTKKTRILWAAARPSFMFTGYDFDPQAANIKATMDSARAINKIGLAAVYGIMNRDNGGYSAGGAPDVASYATWIAKVSAAIGTTKAILVFEPDAMPQLADQTAQGQIDRIKAIHDAIITIKTNNVNTKIYVDAGNPSWKTTTEMNTQLRKINIENADGFSLNVSNFQSDTANVAYGQDLVSKLSDLKGGTLGFIYDTSRNGNNTDQGTFNPPNRQFGRDPQYGGIGVTGLHGYMWVKAPGESDGANTYTAYDGSTQTSPSAGSFWPLYIWNDQVGDNVTDPALGKASGMAQRDPAITGNAYTGGTTGTVGKPAVSNYQGTVAVSGDSALSVGSTAHVVNGSAILIADSFVSTNGQNANPVIISLGGDSQITVSGYATRIGASSMAADSGLAASAGRVAFGSAGISGDSTFGGDGSVVTGGSFSTTSIVQQQTSQSGAVYVNSASIRTISPVTAGNMLVVVVNNTVGQANTTSITDNLGNTWVRAASLGQENYKTTIWYVPNAKYGVTNITLSEANGTTAQWNLNVREYSGIVGFDSVQQVGEPGGNTNHNMSLATTGASDLVIYSYVGYTGSANYTSDHATGLGNVAVMNGQSNNLSSYVADIHGSGTVAGNVVSSVAERGVVTMIAFKYPTSGSVGQYGTAVLVGNSQASFAGGRLAISSVALGGDSSFLVQGFASHSINANLYADSSIVSAGTITRILSASTKWSADSTFTANGSVSQASPVNPIADSTLRVKGGTVTSFELDKSIFVKVYSHGTFLTTWTDLQNEISIPEQINAAGSQIELVLKRLADDYGENQDINEGNEIQIWVSNKGTPNGVCIFKGEITRYKPDFTNEDVTITILSYGNQAQDYVMENGESYDINQIGSGGSIRYVMGTTGEFVITTGMAVQNISAISLIGKCDNNTSVAEINIALFTNQTDARSGNLSAAIGSGVFQAASVFNTEYRVNFATPIPVAHGQTLYGIIWCTRLNGTNVWRLASSTIPVTGFTYYSKDNATTWTSQPTIPQIKTYATTGSTLVSFTQTDPSTMLKLGIDDLNRRGCQIQYTGDSIDMTAAPVDYTFNTQTGLDLFNKVIELAPLGWYLYVDSSTRPATVHFHQRGTTALHFFAIGRDVSALTIEKSNENIVNAVYFIGGGSPALYKKYANQNSINKHGQKAIQYHDARVTQPATADIIARNLIVSNPQILIEISIIDGSFNDFGYPIETVKLGQMVKVDNAGVSASSGFDVAQFDISDFDYDPTNVSSIVFQVTSKKYTPAGLDMSLSSLPPDLSKRIANIKRNVSDIQNANNPTAPVV